MPERPEPVVVPSLAELSAAMRRFLDAAGEPPPVPDDWPRDEGGFPIDPEPDPDD